MNGENRLTVNDLYIELKKLIENGGGDKPVKLSVHWDNCDHIQDLRGFDEEYIYWLVLMGRE